MSFLLGVLYINPLRDLDTHKDIKRKRIAHSFVYVPWLMLCNVYIQDKGCDEVVFKAMGRAINKTVMIAELIKVLLTVAVHVSYASNFILNC